MIENHWLLWPPVAFLLILGAALILLRGLSVFSFPAKGGAAGGKRKAVSYDISDYYVCCIQGCKEHSASLDEDWSITIWTPCGVLLEVHMCEAHRKACASLSDILRGTR